MLKLYKQYINKARCQNTCPSIKCSYFNILNTMLVTVRKSIVIIFSGRNSVFYLNLMTSGFLMINPPLPIRFFPFAFFSLSNITEQQ